MMMLTFWRYCTVLYLQTLEAPRLQQRENEETFFYHLATTTGQHTFPYAMKSLPRDLPRRYGRMHYMQMVQRSSVRFYSSHAKGLKGQHFKSSLLPY